jgi:putative FmdB family regulatory protein
MPTYDYECTTCGHTFEAFQSMSEDPLSKCPECGKKVRRLIGGGVGIIFKGSGFYVTDSKGGGNGSASTKTEPKDGGSEKSEPKEGRKESPEKSQEKSQEKSKKDSGKDSQKSA